MRLVDKRRKKGETMFDFIEDLDAFFCECYEGYDKICVLKGYKMPLMQRSELQNGRMRAYTLPANTMRLALQENAKDLLRQLKEKTNDKTISFSFNTVGLFKRLRKRQQYKIAHQTFVSILKLYQMDKDSIDGLEIDGEIWNNIRKGKYLPSKNLIFSLALLGHLTAEDTQKMLNVYDYDFEYAIEKDVVIAYLLTRKVFNAEMIKAALDEYKIEYLFLKNIK